MANPGYVGIAGGQYAQQYQGIPQQQYFNAAFPQQRLPNQIQMSVGNGFMGASGSPNVNQPPAITPPSPSNGPAYVAGPNSPPAQNTAMPPNVNSNVIIVPATSTSASNVPPPNPIQLVHATIPPPSTAYNAPHQAPPHVDSFIAANTHPVAVQKADAPPQIPPAEPPKVTNLLFLKYISENMLKSILASTRRNQASASIKFQEKIRREFGPRNLSERIRTVNCSFSRPFGSPSN